MSGSTWMTSDSSGAMNLKYTHRALYRAGIYAFKTALTWKAANRDVTITLMPKFTPTTQVCSCCGAFPSEKIDLSVRRYKCEHCGFELDRDSNAARNIYSWNLV